MELWITNITNGLASFFVLEKRHHLKPFAANSPCAEKANRRRSLLDKGGKCCRKCWRNPTERKYRDPDWDWDWGRCDKGSLPFVNLHSRSLQPSPFPHFRVLDFRLEASHPQPKKRKHYGFTTPREPLFPPLPPLVLAHPACRPNLLFASFFRWAPRSSHSVLYGCRIRPSQLDSGLDITIRSRPCPLHGSSQPRPSRREYGLAFLTQNPTFSIRGSLLNLASFSFWAANHCFDLPYA